MKKCLNSVIETTKHLPVEIIVVDNGGNLEDGQFLLGLVQEKKIQHYVRNSENLYFGWGRNLGYQISSGNYLVFSDNDIEYKEGWLDKGLAILKANPDRKIAFTPLRTDRQHRQEKYWRGELEFESEKYLLNLKAGSNSWLIRRKDFEEIGKFRNHKIAGTLWTNDFVNKEYVMATMEFAPLSTLNKTISPVLATDMGFKQGYSFRINVEIKKVLANGEKVILNN
jgi:glycosyltransferase involved in cell wall biosynthesis